jgi:hypothetical protein
VGLLAMTVHRIGFGYWTKQILPEGTVIARTSPFGGVRSNPPIVNTKQYLV